MPPRGVGASSPDAPTIPVRASWMDDSWHTDADADALMCAADPERAWAQRNAEHNARRRPTFPAAEWRGT
jgi:hypothetical protein